MRNNNKIYLFALLALFLTACDFGLADFEDNFYDPVAVEEMGDNFQEFTENPFINASDSAISTFSVDADGAGFAILRKSLASGINLPPYAIRIEELINYFPFDYPESIDGNMIGVNGEVAPCPWMQGHQLIRIGLQGKRIPRNELPAANIVLLVDVSGSMNADDKLPMVQRALRSFVDEMRSEDKIALVTYAGSNRVVLNATSGSEKNTIKQAIDDLSANGGTNGEGGINKAYEIATQNLVEGGNNRVILVSDGDFNVGASSTEDLVKLIEEKRETGVFLTTIGVGSGNFNDAAMEQLANNGNGTYEYLDNLEQAKKLFSYEFEKMYTIAKDVKVQVAFNPEMVKSYRLIGYENRLLQTEDFEDDKKDAGEIGVGQSITAFYEIIPTTTAPANLQIPVFDIDFRYKRVNSSISEPISLSVKNEGNTFEQASENFRFASAIVGAGLLMRDSPYKGTLTKSKILEWASNAQNFDPNNLRKNAISEVLQKLP